MLGYLVAYLASLATMLVFDLFWLGVAGKGLYQAALGALIAEHPNLTAAVLFYLVYPLGILIFAVAPAIQTGWGKAALLGALFGFFNYATYNLTNWAVVARWPATPLAFDLPWGTGLTALVAVVAFLVARAFGAQSAVLS